MGDKTGIEWTDATWNPVSGCDKVSPGCDHCYAETLATRFAGTKAYPKGFEVTLWPERLQQPLRWTRPRRIFVNSMSDLFHDEIPDGYIAAVFAVMLAAKQHTFQVLTKRPGRMRSLLSSQHFHELISQVMHITDDDRAESAGYPRIRWPQDTSYTWPLPNVWLGVSAEDQKWADVRIPVLLKTPAAARFVSAEPLLGPLDLAAYLGDGGCSGCESGCTAWPGCRTGLDWVIVGGESGPGSRPMHPQWAQQLRDQCDEQAVAYLFKQWGDWLPRGRLTDGQPLPVDNERTMILNENGQNKRGRAAGSLSNQLCEFSDGSWCEVIERVGKKAAGRQLGGRTYDGYPSATVSA